MTLKNNVLYPSTEQVDPIYILPVVLNMGPVFPPQRKGRLPPILKQPTFLTPGTI